jgi:nicotinate-nucleotide adenylyltransferase
MSGELTGGRIGVYGGTFDPPHNGHWRVAQNVLEKFALDRMLFVPAFVPPHKRGHAISAAHHRYAMLALATADEARMFVAGIEIEAPSRPYTVETLDRLCREEPGAQLFFLMGADSFAEVTMWREWEKLLSAYSVVVAQRPGIELEPTPAGHLPPELRQNVIDLRGGARPTKEMMTAPHIYLTDYVAENVSATQVRAEIAAGRSVDGLTPPAIANYIAKYRLYR